MIFVSLHVFTGQAVLTSGGHVLASDNKGACVQDQIPQNKSATGTGALTFSSYCILYIYLEDQKYFGSYFVFYFFFYLYIHTVEILL